MNELQIFENPEFGRVRTLMEPDGTTLFCGSDVAKALGYAKPQNAISIHCKGALKRGTPTNGGVQELLFIPESDLYRLVFHSKLPNAEKFTDWVTKEVLPTIRKHGAYMTPETLEQALLSPEFLLKLAQRLKEEQEGRLAAEQERNLLLVQVRQEAPMVEYFKACVDRNMLLSLRETAKLLKVGEKALIHWLLENRYLFRGKSGKLLPYATRPDRAYFEVKEWFDRESGKGGVQTLVTPRGRETFRLLLAGRKAGRLWHCPPAEEGLPPEMTEKERMDIEDWYLSGRYRKN